MKSANTFVKEDLLVNYVV